jgi:hypothetical protein
VGIVMENAHQEQINVGVAIDPVVTQKPITEDKVVVIARGRLKEAKHFFGVQGWSELTQNVLEWGCDHAWMAADVRDLLPHLALQRQKRSVRNWLRSKAPKLTNAELYRMVERTVTSNKCWTHDQSAAVLGISVRDLQEHGYRFFGANDDPNYLIRDAAYRAKEAERKFRARAAKGAAPRELYEANSLSKTKPWEALGISRATYYRRQKVVSDETSPSADIRLRHEPRTHLSHEPLHPSRAPQGDPALDVDGEDHDGMICIIDLDGTEIWLPDDDGDDDLDCAAFAGATAAINTPTVEERRTQ